MAEARESNQGRKTLPVRVHEAEQGWIAARRQVAGVPSDGPLCGLALSGGGIRSATFCLGVLQTLARRGVLRSVDYLSTVSGGGYIGACLSSLLSGAGETGAWAQKQTFDLGEHMPLGCADQVHHLRKHGDFVIARGGLFRRDTLRAVGSIALGLAGTLGLFTALLIAAVGALLFIGSWLTGAELWNAVAAGEWTTWGDALAPIAPGPAPVAWMVVAGAAVGAGFCVQVLRTSAPATGPTAQPPPRTQRGSVGGETRADLAERRTLQLFGGLLLAAVVVATTIAVAVAGPGADERQTLITLPAFVVLGALCAVSAFSIVLAHLVRERVWTRRTRSVFGAAQGICVYSLIGWTVFAAMIVVMWWVRAHGDWLTTVPAALVSLVAARLLAPRAGGPGSSSEFGTRVKAMVPRVLLMIAVPVFVVAATVLCGTFFMERFGGSWRVGLGMVGGGGALFIALGVFVNFNRVSPHDFYRDRLAEAYLVTEAKVGERLCEVRNDYEMRLRDLHEAKADGGAPTAAPYHLIVTALNLPGSRDLARKDRKSDHFVFSKEYCGSTTTGYAATRDWDRYCVGDNKVCRAMTISGAAAASGMGFHTSFTQAFAMTLLNIRLGYWLPNPDRCETNTLSGNTSLDALCADGTITERRAEAWSFWPAYLLRELTASMHADGKKINLSDGGHTGDNLGLYPLLQRRCELIVACDSERDGDYAFSSLSAGIRQIFVDENVEVEIDLDRIRPPAPGEPPRANFVVGEIRYPDCGDRGGTATGYLIILKSSLMAAGEPAAVRSYAAQHPDFPHETTADQFFDDDQFESYRRLGAEIASRALDAAGVVRGGERSAPDTLIAWCRAALGRAAPAAPAARKGPRASPPPPAAGPAHDPIEAIRAALDKHAGSTSKAAFDLGISSSTLRRRMRKLGIA